MRPSEAEGDSMRKQAKGWDRATVASVTLARNRLEMLCEEFDAALEAQDADVLLRVAVDLFKLAGMVMSLPAFVRSPMEVLRAEYIADRLTPQVRDKEGV
jgi:hypothetical protein